MKYNSTGKQITFENLAGTLLSRLRGSMLSYNMRHESVRMIG